MSLYVIYRQFGKAKTTTTTSPFIASRHSLVLSGSLRTFFYFSSLKRSFYCFMPCILNILDINICYCDMMAVMVTVNKTEKGVKNANRVRLLLFYLVFILFSKRHLTTKRFKGSSSIFLLINQIIFDASWIYNVDICCCCLKRGNKQQGSLFPIKFKYYFRKNKTKSWTEKVLLNKFAVSLIWQTIKSICFI